MSRLTGLPPSLRMEAPEAVCCAPGESATWERQLRDSVLECLGSVSRSCHPMASVWPQSCSWVNLTEQH